MQHRLDAMTAFLRLCRQRAPNESLREDHFKQTGRCIYSLTALVLNRKKCTLLFFQQEVHHAVLSARLDAGPSDRVQQRHFVSCRLITAEIETRTDRLQMQGLACNVMPPGLDLSSGECTTNISIPDIIQGHGRVRETAFDSQIMNQKRKVKLERTWRITRGALSSRGRTISFLCVQHKRTPLE